MIDVSSMSGYVNSRCGERRIVQCLQSALIMPPLHLSLELSPYSLRANAICLGRLNTRNSIHSVLGDIEKLLPGADTVTVWSDLP